MMTKHLHPEIGKVYRKASGEVGTAAPTNYKNWECQIGDTLYRQGHTPVRDGECVVSEVIMTDVLPFELKAGQKYNTTKPDGTPGPVVELYSRTTRDQFNGFLPLGAHSDSMQEHGITRDGLIVAKFCGGQFDGYRITSEYTEPKPPTIAERLEGIIGKMNKIPTPLNFVSNQKEFISDLESLAADVRKLEGGAA